MCPKVCDPLLQALVLSLTLKTATSVSENFLYQRLKP